MSKRAKAGKAPPPSQPSEVTVTSLALPTELWTALKVRAAQERRTLREIAQEAIEAHLRGARG